MKRVQGLAFGVLGQGLELCETDFTQGAEVSKQKGSKDTLWVLQISKMTPQNQRPAGVNSET